MNAIIIRTKKVDEEGPWVPLPTSVLPAHRITYNMVDLCIVCVSLTDVVSDNTTLNTHKPTNKS